MRSTVGGVDCWARRAAGSDAPAAARLTATARVLAAVRHPGVVDLVTLDGEAGAPRLLTRWVGPSVAERPPATAGEVAGIGAVAATTLADLHALGWAHRAVRPEHLLVDGDGRPVWCGLGDASKGPEGQEGDVEALLGLLEDLARGVGEPARGLTRALRRGRRQPVAAALARRLADPRLGAHLPGHPPAPTDRAVRGRRSRHPTAAGVLGVGASVLVVALGGLVAAGGLGPAGGLGAAGHPGPAGVPRRAGVPCPPADDGCRGLPAPGGTVATPSGRFEVGIDAAVVVLGRWRCGAAALPAALDEATGRVWAWPAWAAPGRPVTAHLVGVVAGADGLSVLPGPGRCDHLQVTVGGHPAVTLQPGGLR